MTMARSWLAWRVLRDLVPLRRARGTLFPEPPEWVLSSQKKSLARGSLRTGPALGSFGFRLPNMRRVIEVSIHEQLYEEAHRAALQSNITVRSFVEQLVESELAQRRLRMLPPPEPHHRPIGYRGGDPKIQYLRRARKCKTVSASVPPESRNNSCARDGCKPDSSKATATSLRVG
jgi:hypothetical protein